MNVLIDNGSYRMDNMGDVAMLQVTVARLRERWPNVRIRVLVETPDRLEMHCPGVEPVRPSPWHVLPIVPRAGAWRGARLRQIERRMPLVAPRLAYLGKRRYTRRQTDPLACLDEFYTAVQEADMVICSGGGYINDHHAEHADKVLHTLALAQGLGKPTAMFGVGLGPLADSPVHRLAGEVLRRLDVLALREEQAAMKLLREMNACSSRVTLTGDDAIDLAVGAPPASRRDALGVNVRVAEHARASEATVRALGPVVAELAHEVDAPLQPLVVRSRQSPKNDVEGLRLMFEDAPHAPLDLGEAERVTSPADLVEQAGRCRVVVTGAYHAAVFALSQGASVVALSGTRYYDQKFGGLARLFGAGITILRYDQAGLLNVLRRSVRRAWQQGPQIEGVLRRSAERQVHASRSAYNWFMDKAASDPANHAVAMTGLLIAGAAA